MFYKSLSYFTIHKPQATYHTTSITSHMSCVTNYCHMSQYSVIHMSLIICHMSPVSCHVSQVTVMSQVNVMYHKSHDICYKPHVKYNIVIVLIAIIIASSSVADEAKSSSKQQQQHIQQSQNNVPLSSSVNDAKQQNKRLAFFAPTSTLSTGFKPIPSSYPTVSNFVGNHHYQQPYTSGLTSSYVKYPYGNQQQQQQQQFVSPSNVKFSSPSSAYSRPAPLSYGYHNNNNYQLAFAASQPAAVSYLHSPYQLAQQIFTQQLPLHNYNVQQISPFMHAPTLGYFGQYQAPAQSQYQQYGSLNKYPQISSFHQPQTYNVASQQQQQHQQQSSSPKHSQLITSKPVALEAPITSHSSSNHDASPSTSSSSSSSLDSSLQSGEVHHNQHGAISYSNFLQPFDKSHPSFPTAAALIATQPPPHVYYHHHHNHHHQAPPQTFVDYSKHFSGGYNLPIAQNYYHGFNNAHAQSAPVQPYAHISKLSVMPTPSVPAPQVVSVSVVPTIPQKISLH
ncbi:serine/threonine-protein kinase Wnk-like [Chironomus tepperi]|uniref:serine/threonine-protein kinase Wnk-like n=1 Tax=Chironomus tepperi TaxID=113505 RepID=UPI00391F80A8